MTIRKICCFVGIWQKGERKTNTEPQTGKQHATTTYLSYSKMYLRLLSCIPHFLWVEYCVGIGHLFATLKLGRSL